MCCSRQQAFDERLGLASPRPRIDPAQKPAELDKADAVLATDTGFGFAWSVSYTANPERSQNLRYTVPRSKRPRAGHSNTKLQSASFAGSTSSTTRLLPSLTCTIAGTATSTSTIGRGSSLAT